MNIYGLDVVVGHDGFNYTRKSFQETYIWYNALGIQVSREMEIELEVEFLKKMQTDGIPV